MQRRTFISLIGAASVAPALPGVPAAGTVGAASVQTAAYNRYMYGLAVFQARTKAGISTADLMARLRVTAVQAEAMMGEMTAKGVLRQVTRAGAVKVVSPMQQSNAQRAAKRVVNAVVEHLQDKGEDGQNEAVAPVGTPDGTPTETPADTV